MLIYGAEALLSLVNNYITRRWPLTARSACGEQLHHQTSGRSPRQHRSACGEQLLLQQLGPQF
ncbi:hypothetical protein GQ600_7144 [Phytophthora cactorum]|nr:hypothetical protein GQ600_7144 [Phytophthora cactorum]